MSHDSEKMNIVQKLSAAAADAGAVRKGAFNSAQKFNFRGIDEKIIKAKEALEASTPKKRKPRKVVDPKGDQPTQTETDPKTEKVDSDDA